MEEMISYSQIFCSSSNRELVTVQILTSSPDIIADRRRLRDGMDHSVEDITRFQNEEFNYATKIANELQVPFFVSLGEDDLDKTLDFIRVIMGR